MKERILHLTLTKEWFDLIKSGEKKVEYREIKPYWIKRLTDYNTKTFVILSKNLNKHIKKFDYIIFTNGYGNDKPKLKVKWKGMFLGRFEDEKCFAIKLGKIKVLK